MKKTAILFIMAVIGLNVFAQDYDFKAPDYKVIQKSISDPASTMFYPKLIEKYNRADPSLTLEEKRHLYFGYIFQPTFSAIDSSSYNRSMMEILSKSSFAKEDYSKLLADANALLLEDPFNPRALNAKMLVYAQLDNVEEYKKVAEQRKIVLDAIVSSGDGITKKTAFYVTKVAHEYDLLSMLGYTFGGSDNITDHYNYLKLGKNKYGIEGLYFDITPTLNFMSKHNR